MNSERVMFTIDVLMRHLPPCSLPSLKPGGRRKRLSERERRGKLHAAAPVASARLMKRKPLKYNAKKEGAKRKPAREREEEKRGEDGVSPVPHSRLNYCVSE